VGDEVREWEEGRSLVFDDVFEHEAWNDADGTRVVLFVDFVRPLRAPASWLNEVMIRAIGISPFVLDARARHNDWERRFERLRGRAA
jgi:beta-hydroxylase